MMLTEDDVGGLGGTVGLVQRVVRLERLCGSKISCLCLDVYDCRRPSAKVAFVITLFE
jgi:hypothetical protein